MGIYTTPNGEREEVASQRICTPRDRTGSNGLLFSYPIDSSSQGRRSAVDVRLRARIPASLAGFCSLFAGLFLFFRQGAVGRRVFSAGKGNPKARTRIDIETETS